MSCMFYFFDKVLFLYLVMVLSNFDVKVYSYYFFNVHSAFFAKYPLETFREFSGVFGYSSFFNIVFLFQNMIDY